MTPQPFDSLPLHRPDNVGIAPDAEEESHVRLSIPCVLMACSCLFEFCPHRAKFFAYSLLPLTPPAPEYPLPSTLRASYTRILPVFICLATCLFFA